MKSTTKIVNLSIKMKLLIVATLLLVVPTVFFSIKDYNHAKSELDAKGN